jgi:hypothetical protein
MVVWLKPCKSRSSPGFYLKVNATQWVAFYFVQLPRSGDLQQIIARVLFKNKPRFERGGVLFWAVFRASARNKQN